MTAMNPDLAAERANALPFLKRLSVIIYGADDIFDKIGFVDTLLRENPQLCDPKDVNFMTREERYENVMRKSTELYKLRDRLDLTDLSMGYLIRRAVFGHDASPLELHYVMFLPAIQAQATDEQLEKWLPITLMMGINGTYAQTEMGHGTDLRRLETTATFDHQKDEFVLNSPTITSTKWWPGNLGKSTNFAVVSAQLWISGECYGPHLFIVQLRHLETHIPLPGVTVGDIGPKFYLNCNDNGFLRLNNVRIPREQMLMRHAKVLRDGTYMKPPHEKVSYGTMLSVRANMILDLANLLARAVTIAIRYSCVRRQGEMEKGGGDVKVMDYQTQQYKLLPALAATYAFRFAGMYVHGVHTNVAQDVKAGNVELLPELHALTSGLKAFVSWEAMRGVEVCRLACGGHGFMLASGLPDLYTAANAACTYEGENTVMLLQAARYLMKAYRSKTSSNHGGHSMRYLSKQFPAKSSLDQIVSLDALVDLYQHTAQRSVAHCDSKLGRLQISGRPDPEAWNLCTVELTRAAKAHVGQFVLKNFGQRLKSLPPSDKGCADVLEQLAVLYGCYGVYKSPGKFLENGYLSHQQLTLVKDKLFALLTQIRPLAVQLTDAFLFKDRDLHSVLGRYDGQVYENLLKHAQDNPFNEHEVMPCHHKYLGKMMADARHELSKL